MNVRACSLIRKTSCCHDAKEQEICEDDFSFIFAKEVVVALTSLSVDEVLINTHATCMSRYGPAGPLAAFACALRRRSSVQPDCD